MDTTRPDAPELQVVGAAILDGRRCLVAQRSETMALPLKWEFPGGKVDDGEPAPAALAREVREELGLEVAVGELLGVSVEQLGPQPIRLAVYLCQAIGGELVPLEHREVRWVEASALEALDWASADRPLLEPLRRALARHGE